MTADDSTPTPLAPYDDLARLIASRRTSMFVQSGREVPVDVVEQLCELAAWAPNHKRTWPWRFALFTGGGRARLGETMVADMVDAEFGDEGKRLKTATKYLRTPAVLAVGCAPHPDTMLDQENRDAVAAAIQNLMLGATAMGIATFWSTPALTRPPKVLDLCGFDHDVRVVGLVYLGWADDDNCPLAPERPPVDLAVVDS
ncbi:nitroreductase family protein [Ilumatobacter sp.]|uniref:nitroreductase family protein n=1 Tax=Ilumatobacter sp. TaxID=1967498 RepID=UPI003B5257AF